MTAATRIVTPSAVALAMFLCFPLAAVAQPEQPAPSSGTPAQAAQSSPPATTAPLDEPEDPPAELNLVNLPTTTSLNRHQSYFRITHRFARDLRRGDFGSLAEDFFSLDNGAVIGLEYRFGITRDLQAGVHRTTLSKTIQFFGRYEVRRQDGDFPLGISVLGSIEGLSNFHQNYQPGAGVTVSRRAGRWLDLYATPAFVAHTQAADTLAGHDHGLPGEDGAEDEHSEHDGTAFVGFGARIRFRPTAFVAAEYSPRVSGHDPGRGTWAVAVEKQTAGHIMQLNISNSFGTTLGELARGGSPHDIYLGFNMIRRF